MTSPENAQEHGSRDRPDRAVGSVDTELDRAVQAADAAALAAGVAVRELTDLAELTAVVALYAGSGAATQSPPMTLELLRAFTKAGNYVGGAFDGDRAGRRVRRVLPRARARTPCTATSPASRRGWPGRNVGFALKLHQRAWALLRGVSDDRLDLRPAGEPQRLLQPGQARRPAGGVPAELLRRDARQHQRRRRLRPAAGALAAARPGRRGGVRRARRRAAVAADELAGGAVVALGHRRRRRAPCPAGSTARPRWSPCPPTSAACAPPTRRSRSAGGSRCATRSRR